MRMIHKPGVVGPLASPQPLRLRVAGFGGARPGAAEVLQALQVVPSFHLASLREIEYAPEEAATVPYSVQAAYIQAQRCIRFYRLSAGPEFEHVLHHEIGHHVLALVVSSEIRGKWITEIFRASAPASAYGATNAEEDFAESYARYLRSSAADPGFAHKRKFLGEYVFSGAPWTLKRTASR